MRTPHPPPPYLPPPPPSPPPPMPPLHISLQFPTLSEVVYLTISAFVEFLTFFYRPINWPTKEGRYRSSDSGALKNQAPLERNLLYWLIDIGFQTHINKYCYSKNKARVYMDLGYMELLSCVALWISVEVHSFFWAVQWLLGSMFGIPWYKMSYIGLVIFVQ